MPLRGDLIMVFDSGASVLWTTPPLNLVCQRDGCFDCVCVPSAFFGFLWCNETSPLRLCGKKGARELSRPSSEDVCDSPADIGGRFCCYGGRSGWSHHLRSCARSEHDQCALFLYLLSTCVLLPFYFYETHWIYCEGKQRSHVFILPSAEKNKCLCKLSVQH